MNEPSQENQRSVPDPHEKAGHVPPYDHQRYAQYAPEPWDENPSSPTGSQRVWYFLVAFTVGVMLMGAFLVGMGMVCHFNPQWIFQAQANAQSTMTHTFKDISEVKSAASVYWSLGGLYILSGAMVFFMPRNLLLWGYAIALMFLAAMSICYAPFSIAMFIYWMLPGTRAYFQK